MRNNLLKTTLAIAFAGLSGATWAATDTSQSIAVSATVAQSCVATAGGTMAFGSYDPIGTNATADLESTTTFSVKCTRGSPSVTVGLGAGLHASGAQRALLNTAPLSTEKLNYNFFEPTGAALDTCTSPYSGLSAWTTSTNFAIPAAFWTGSTGAQPIKVCGSAPSAQNAAAGTYQDTVTITVTF